MYIKLVHAAALALAVVTVGSLLGCTMLGPSRAYCQTAGDCDEGGGLGNFDPVGSSSDSVDVCIVQQDTSLAAMRANSEEICQELAAAWEEYMLCAAEEGCDAFEFTEDECKDELEDFFELSGDAGNRCNE